MSERIEIRLGQSDDVFDVLRRLVPHSVDRPVAVFRSGKHSLTLASLYRCACLTVAEEPGPRFVPYRPHPNAEIGTELAELLEEYALARARMREAAKLARKAKEAYRAAEKAEKPLAAPGDTEETSSTSDCHR